MIKTTSAARLFATLLVAGSAAHSAPSMPFRENSDLLRAIGSGDVAGVKAALHHGADPNATSELGDHAINLAADSGKTQICQILISVGANANVYGSQDKTPLMSAAEAGNADVVNLLLLHKASVRARTQLQETPLLFAARNGNAACISSLVNAGSDTAALDSLGETPLLVALHTAAQIGSTTGLATIVAHANVNLADSLGRTPLMHAAREQAPDEIKLLLARGANPGVKDASGHTALMYAAFGESRVDKTHSSPDTAAMLLAVSLRPKVDGPLALFLSAASGNDGAASGLLEEGCPVNASLDLSMTPAIRAANSANSAHPMEFVAGMTPAMVAAAYGNTAVLQALLDAHANASARDVQGRTALMYAARFGREAAVKTLLGHGVDVDASDTDGLTALMHLASLGGGPDDAGVAKDLINAGADPVIKNVKGETALDIAQKSGNSIVKSVIEQQSK